jgi:hypothetical protein
MTRCSRTPGELVQDELLNEIYPPPPPLESEIESWQSTEVTFPNLMEVCS